MMVHEKLYANLIMYNNLGRNDLKTKNLFRKY